MANNEELRAIFSGISDEELVRRINSEDLTNVARNIAQKELNLREINLSQFKLDPVEEPDFSKIKLKLKPIITQVLTFPLKAFSGSEPLWVVATFGLLFTFVGNQLLLQYFLIKSASPPSFTTIYIVLGCRLVIYVFISIAIWRSAYNTKFKMGPIIAFFFSALIVLSVLRSTYIISSIAHEYKPVNSSNIMENSVIKIQ